MCRTGCVVGLFLPKMHFDLTENSKDAALSAITVYCQCLLGNVATNEIELYDAPMRSRLRLCLTCCLFYRTQETS